jgi:Holliday junction resolvase RusA-like endonuclease
VSIEVRVKRRKKPDLDNVAKLILDAMTDAGIIADDVQVDRLSIERTVDGRAPEGVAVTWGPA